MSPGTSEKNRCWDNFLMAELPDVTLNAAAKRYAICIRPEESDIMTPLAEY